MPDIDVGTTIVVRLWSVWGRLGKCVIMPTSMYMAVAYATHVGFAGEQ